MSVVLQVLFRYAVAILKYMETLLMSASSSVEVNNLMRYVGDYIHDVDSLAHVCSLFVADFITALHGMQTQSSDENSVRLSVCPSVHHSVCPSNAWIVTKQKKNQSRFLYHTNDRSA